MQDMESEPVLIVFKGQPATGKSTLAKNLSESLGWRLLSRDEIKEKLLSDGEENLGKKSHELMWDLAKDELESGKSCILDTNLNQKVAYDDLVELGKNVRAKILVIECICDEVVQKIRFDERSKMALSPFWIKSWDEYQLYLTSFKNDGDFEIKYPALKINTSETLNFDRITNLILDLL